MGVGQPPKYKTPEEMQLKIDEYFAKCDKGETISVVRKGGVIEVERKIPYTVEGLCLALGFADRSSLLDYKDQNDEYFHIIAQAKTKIARNNIEGGMLGEYEPKITGLNLQANFGYATVSKSEITGPEGGPIELTNLERAAKLAFIQKLAEAREAKKNKGD